MSTLVYAPSVQIHIATTKGIIDVSADIIRGSVTRNTNAPSALEFDLLNPRHKYDGLFTPMDRVVCYLRRTRQLLSFSGYLNTVPVWSAAGGNIHLDATDTLKRLQQFLWDPHSSKAQELIQAVLNAEGTQDGGMALRTRDLLNQVAGWPVSQIHIARVPDKWFTKVSHIAESLVLEAEKYQAMQAVGSDAYLNGNNTSLAGMDSKPGIGPGTGQLPARTGRATEFATEARGQFALTAPESPARPKDPYYCAMRWPYATMGPGHNDDRRPAPGVDVAAAKSWWANQLILVVNPVNGKGVVVRATDWGPATWTRNAIDLGPGALKEIATHPGDTSVDTVNIAFAPAGAKPGPVKITPGAEVGGTLASAGGVQTWGDPRSAGFEQDHLVDITIKQIGPGTDVTVRVNKRCAAQFQGFLNELSTHYHINQSDTAGFVGPDPKTGKYRVIAGTNTLSNHAYGAAVDVNWQENPRASGSSGRHEIDANLARTTAHKWGLWWGGDYRTNPDYMHFEAIGAPATPTGSNVTQFARPDLDGAAVGASSASSGTSNVGAGTNDLNTTLFNLLQWVGSPDYSGDLLPGIRALMNDEPILQTVDTYMQSALRDYCSAPNGDFIAWFPDYFGWWGTAGKIVVSPLEIEKTFSVTRSDEHLKTHFFVVGATNGIQSLEGAGDASALYQQLGTAGIASVEMPELMRALFNTDPGVFADNGRAFLNRYGARVDYAEMNNINGSGSRQEFFFAVFRFMRNWAQQFSEQINLTFLPEMYPGMLACFPVYGVQGYIQSVRHDFSTYEGSDGFSTSPEIIGWSTLGKINGPLGALPQGAPL